MGRMTAKPRPSPLDGIQLRPMFMVVNRSRNWSRLVPFENGSRTKTRTEPGDSWDLVAVSLNKRPPAGAAFIRTLFIAE